MEDLILCQFSETCETHVLITNYISFALGFEAFLSYYPVSCIANNAIQHF